MMLWFCQFSRFWRYIVTFRLDLLDKCTAVYLEISFSKTSYHIETSQLIFKANWVVSECYQFLLKGISEQDLVPRPLVNPPEVLRLCIRSCSIKRSGKRPPQKRSSLWVTWSAFMKCLCKPEWITWIWDTVWRCKYTDLW